MGESLLARWPIGRPVILLGLAFVVGIAIGWVATRPFVGSAPRNVTNTDYVAVVGQLFERDHNQEVARERLALLGPPSNLVAQAVQDAKAGKVTSQSDRAALTTLAAALAPTSGAAASVNPAGSAAPASQTNGSTSAASDGQTSWLGPVIAFLLAFALGTIVLLRTAGLSPRLGLGFLDRFGRSSGSDQGTEEARSSWSPPSAPRTVVAAGRVHPRSDALAGGDNLRDVNVRRDDDLDEEPAVAASGGRTATLVRPTPPRPVTAGKARRVAFESTYRLGDDPFDEIHPITDPATGALIGACGLSSALKIDGASGPRYYAFTAWVQDYLSGEQLHAIGLVTRWAQAAKRAQIDDWVRTGQIDGVLPVQPGLTTDLTTDTIATTISVGNVEQGTETTADDHFTALNVRFELTTGQE